MNRNWLLLRRWSVGLANGSKNIMRIQIFNVRGVYYYEETYLKISGGGECGQKSVNTDLIETVSSFG